MSTRKLLLADDSITIQKVVNLTFADEGIEVITVGNGDSAMEKLAEISPDLVMADVNMPGLTGYQVCERIKQNENYKNTPVILLVGSFEPFNEDEARRVGADDFLTKPFQSIRQLVSKVTVLLDAKDRNAANIYDATANNSFADTLEMNESEVTNYDQANDLGDAGMDDEMIQSTPVNSFALDESAKFETKDFASHEDSEDYKKTQPLSVYDLKEFSFVADSPENKNESRDFTENSNANESPFESISENTAVNNSEPDDFADNKVDEPARQSESFVEHHVNESQPDAPDFYESVLEEDDVSSKKKEDFSSFLDYSDDDLLEIPFDEDDEWDTAEDEESAKNDSPESTDPTPVTEGNEQNPAVASEEKKTDEFAEQNQVAEENKNYPPAESEERSADEQFEAQNNSLIEELPQPDSLEEHSTDESSEFEKKNLPETAEETLSDEFNNDFPTESANENLSEEFKDKDTSPETFKENLQNEDTKAKFVETEHSYHDENEIVVGSLLKPENNENNSVSEEKAENTPENQSISESAAQFSPELIDAVARRVVELLSDKVVREIAWEIVPQHADLVIKKAIEEKLAGEKLTE